MFKIGDKVFKRTAPGARGTICEICPNTGRYRVQWAASAPGIEGNS